MASAGKRRRVIATIVALVALQVAALLLYRLIGDARRTSADTSFPYERVNGNPVFAAGTLVRRDGTHWEPTRFGVDRCFCISGRLGVPLAARNFPACSSLARLNPISK